MKPDNMEFPKRNKDAASKEYASMKIEEVKKKVKEGKYKLIKAGQGSDHYENLETKKEFVFNKRTGEITELQSEQLGGTFGLNEPLKQDKDNNSGVGWKKNFPD